MNQIQAATISIASSDDLDRYVAELSIIQLHGVIFTSKLRSNPHSAEQLAEHLLWRIDQKII